MCEFLRALAGAISDPVFDDADTAGEDVGRVDLAQPGICIGKNLVPVIHAAFPDNLLDPIHKILFLVIDQNKFYEIGVFF